MPWQRLLILEQPWEEGLSLEHWTIKIIYLVSSEFESLKRFICNLLFSTSIPLCIILVIKPFAIILIFLERKRVVKLNACLVVLLWWAELWLLRWSSPDPQILWIHGKGDYGRCDWESRPWDRRVFCIIQVDSVQSQEPLKGEDFCKKEKWQQKKVGEIQHCWIWKWSHQPWYKEVIGGWKRQGNIVLWSSLKVMPLY